MDSLEEALQGMRRYINRSTGIKLENIVIGFENRRQSQNPDDLYSIITYYNTEYIGRPHVSSDSIEQESVIKFRISFLGKDAMFSSLKMFNAEYNPYVAEVLYEYKFGVKRMRKSDHLPMKEVNEFVESSSISMDIWKTIVTKYKYETIDSYSYKQI